MITSRAVLLSTARRTRQPPRRPRSSRPPGTADVTHRQPRPRLRHRHPLASPLATPTPAIPAARSSRPRPQRRPHKGSSMIIALLAVLGVDLIVIVALMGRRPGPGADG